MLRLCMRRNITIGVRGCQYGAQSKLSYEEHMGQNHPDQVPKEYKCQWCSKVCKGPISLKRHQQFRLCTKKKFQCDICKKFYKTTEGLNFHKESEHGNKANRPCLSTMWEKFFYSGKFEDSSGLACSPKHVSPV